MTDSHSRPHPDDPLDEAPHHGTHSDQHLFDSEPHTLGLDVKKKRRPPTNLADAMVKALRPKQWVKNVLVIAAPAAAAQEVTFTARTVVDVVLAFLVFCCAASSIYLVNDARDVEADKEHPTKRFRPIASGMLPVGLAYAMAVGLIVVAVGVAFLASAGPALAITVGVYIVLQLGYCFGWKHQPVIDIALVSSGFMLRAMAGGVAAGIALSQWFLLVAAFGSLFMASGKRYSELLLSQRTGAKIRKALRGYTATYLRFVWTLAATAVVMSYALWGFEMSREAMGFGGIMYQISMVPFSVAILRYAADVDRGDGGAPEELALGDRVLQILAVLWLLCVGAAAFAAGA